MANHGGGGGNSKRASSTPVKWTLVEAEPETPQGQRKQGYARSRGQTSGGRGGSGSAGNWRSSSRDGGRGRGGGNNFSNGHRGNRRGGGGGGIRSNQGQGRGRGYANGMGAYVGGATYYVNRDHSNRDYGNGIPSFEEQKAYKVYMTGMAVRQIEFYFTVENLCRDIFMRSYMDEEGYIPIAFVANFPGVARFGVDLPDITAGILASDTLQVDIENETMRMKEGWEVWLLPNQATGKQGVPRYIKVGPSMISADPHSAPGSTEPQAAYDEAAGPTDAIIELNGQGNQPGVESDANGIEPLVPPQQEGLPAASTRGKYDQGVSDAKVSSAVVLNDKGQDTEVLTRKDVTKVTRRKSLTPTAPAWTPSAPVEINMADERKSAGEDLSVAVPPVGSADDWGGLTKADDNRKSTENPIAHESTIKPPEDESHSDVESPGNDSIGDGDAQATTSKLIS